ncbi:MAG: ketopantoate reductase family protein, partial [Anaerolineales bacterium]
MRTLKVLSFGAGAIGTYLGGSLLKSGHEVSFIERKDIVVQLKEQGIVLHSKSGKYQSKQIKVFESIAEALNFQNYDVALVAVKAYDTQNLAQSLTPYKSIMPPLLCLQNGVENEPIYRACLGNDKVIGASVTSAIQRVNAG